MVIMISVILHKPEVAGNVGAVARLMSNFGLSQLVLVNPQCDVSSLEAEGRAKHARHILRNAEIVKDIPKVDTLVGTTGRVGMDFNIPRSPLSPRQVSGVLAPLLKKEHHVGLLFGSEGHGLSNEVVQKCDFTVSIPAMKGFQTLNLSHAVGIVLYELFVATHEVHSTSHFRLVSGVERDALLKYIDGLIDGMSWSGPPSRKETQKLIWRRVFAKSFLTKREAFGLFGFLKRVKTK